MPSKAPRESRSQPPRKRSFGTARRVPLKKPLTVVDPWSARRGAARLQRGGTAAVSFVGRLLLLLVPASITKGGEIGEGGGQAASGASAASCTAPAAAALASPWTRRRSQRLRHIRGDAVSGAQLAVDGGGGLSGYSLSDLI